MLLADFVGQYLLSRRVSPTYAERILRRAEALAVRSGHSKVAEALSEPVVNCFLSSLDVSAVTVGSYRSDILTLWRAAADRDLAPYPNARRIVRVAAPALIVDCYLLEEARALLAAAAELAGDYAGGLSKRLYWTAAIRLAWDSGLRRGDVWAVRRSLVRPDGLLRIVQHKTGQVAQSRLRPATVAALDAIGRELPLAWPLDPSFFGRHFKRLVKAAGVNRGSFKWLRRASGSYVEAQQSGAGHKHLGHATPQIFSRHYDARLGERELPLPPEL